MERSSPANDERQGPAGRAKKGQSNTGLALGFAAIGSLVVFGGGLIAGMWYRANDQIAPGGGAKSASKEKGASSQGSGGQEALTFYETLKNKTGYAPLTPAAHPTESTSGNTKTAPPAVSTTPVPGGKAAVPDLTVRPGVAPSTPYLVSKTTPVTPPAAPPLDPKASPPAPPGRTATTGDVPTPSREPAPPPPAAATKGKAAPGSAPQTGGTPRVPASQEVSRAAKAAVGPPPAAHAASKGTGHTAKATTSSATPRRPEARVQEPKRRVQERDERDEREVEPRARERERDEPEDEPKERVRPKPKAPKAPAVATANKGKAAAPKAVARTPAAPAAGTSAASTAPRLGKAGAPTVPAGVAAAPPPLPRERRPDPESRPEPRPKARPQDNQKGTEVRPSAPATSPTLAANDGEYSVQVGSFSTSDQAERIRSNLSKKGYPVRVQASVVPGQGVRYRVRVGSFGDADTAGQTARNLTNHEQMQAIVAR